MLERYVPISGKRAKYETIETTFFKYSWEINFVTCERYSKISKNANKVWFFLAKNKTGLNSNFKSKLRKIIIFSAKNKATAFAWN